MCVCVCGLEGVCWVFLKRCELVLRDAFYWWLLMVVRVIKRENHCKIDNLKSECTGWTGPNGVFELL